MHWVSVFCVAPGLGLFWVEYCNDLIQSRVGIESTLLFLSILLVKIPILHSEVHIL